MVKLGRLAVCQRDPGNGAMAADLRQRLHTIRRYTVQYVCDHNHSFVIKSHRHCLRGFSAERERERESNIHKAEPRPQTLGSHFEKRLATVQPSQIAWRQLESMELRLPVSLCPPPPSSSSSSYLLPPSALLMQQQDKIQRRKMATPLPIKESCAISSMAMRAKSSDLIRFAVTSSSDAVCSPPRQPSEGVKG